MSDSAPTADTPRILVIDDEEKLRSFLNRALTRLGYEVRTAASGEAGVKAYLEDPAELVLTDLKMGDLDGIEVVRQIRAEDAGAVIIDDCRNFSVWGNGQKIIGMLVALGDVNAVCPVLETGFFQHNRHFAPVWCRP